MAVRRNPMPKKARLVNGTQDFPSRRLARLSVKPLVVRLARLLEERMIGKLRAIAWSGVSEEGSR